MPTDKATQVSLGLFHGLPDWFKRAQGVELNPAGAFPRSRGRGQSVSQGPKYIEEGRADSRNTSKIRGNGGNSACRGDLGGRRVEEYLQPFPAPASKSVMLGPFVSSWYPAITFSSQSKHMHYPLKIVLTHSPLRSTIRF